MKYSLCVRGRPLIRAELGADKAVEADALLGGLEGKRSMNVRRNPDKEAAAVGSAGQGRRRLLSVFSHIRDAFGDKLADPLKSRLRSLGQPAQRRKFQTEAGIFSVVFRPSDPIGVSVIVLAHRDAPIFLLPTKPA